MCLNQLEYGINGAEWCFSDYCINNNNVCVEMSKDYPNTIGRKSINHYCTPIYQSVGVDYCAKLVK